MTWDIIFDVKKIEIKKLNRREIEIINFLTDILLSILNKRAKKQINKGSLSKVIKDVKMTENDDSKIKNLFRQVKITHEWYANDRYIKFTSNILFEISLANNLSAALLK